MGYMTSSFSWIVKQNNSQPQPIQNYYQALLRFNFHIQNPHKYDRIKKESWKAARVEVPVIGFRFKYDDSLHTFKASWLENLQSPTPAGLSRQYRGRTGFIRGVVQMIHKRNRDSITGM